MNRLEALERVAEAARQWAEGPADYALTNWGNTKAALAVLDTLPPEPAGEVVEVVQDVWWHSEWRECRATEMNPVAARSAGWQHIATIRARVPLPRVPEVVGEVEG